MHVTGGMSQEPRCCVAVNLSLVLVNLPALHHIHVTVGVCLYFYSGVGQ